MGLNSQDAGVGKVNSVVLDVAVLGYGASFMVELSNIVLMLADSLLKVLRFPDVCDRAVRAGNFINDALCSFLRRAIFWTGHESTKRRHRLVGHLDPFFGQYTCQRLACTFYVRNADA